MLHIYTPNQYPYQRSTSYTHAFQDIPWQGQKSNQSHTMGLQTFKTPMTVPIKYQIPTSYSFQDIALTRF